MSRNFVLLNEATAARRRVYFQLVDATDGITPEAGEAGGQPQISTNGGAWTNTGIGTLSAISAAANGRYYADLTQTAVNGTTGDIIETRYKSANTAEAVGDTIQVISLDLWTALGSATVGTVTTATTCTTLTGHTAQTGDSFARIGANGAGLTDLALATELAIMRDLLEFKRGGHTITGNVYYVDPVNGNDGNAGTRALPKLTIQNAHDNLVTDSNHDGIIVLAGASGQTTMTEDVTLTKRYLGIRIVGRDVIWTRSGAGSTITLSGDGISISGCRVQTAATGTGAGVEITSGADYCGLYNLWFEDTQGDGILVEDASNTIIKSCVFEECGKTGSAHAIELKVTSGSVDHTFIRDCHISNPRNDGIKISGTGVEDTVIENCTIHGAGVGGSGYGINIATGAVDTQLTHNDLGQNTDGDVLDNGTTTTYNAAATAAAVADQVWVEAIADHSGTAGSTAEALASVATSAGARSITIHLQDSGAVAIAGAKVTVNNEADTGLVTLGTTDTNGDLVVALDDATYKLHINLGGWSFTDPETMVVTATATHTFTGTSISTGAVSSPDGCMVFGTLKNGVVAHASVTVKMYELTATPQVEDSVIMSGKPITTTTDANGYFEIEMAAGTKIVVEIPEAGILHTVELPDTTTYDLMDEWD